MLEALRAGVTKAIETAGPDFGQALQDLNASVERVPRFDLICFNALYFLTGPIGENPEFNRPEGVFQNHVELIQAVALRTPVDDPEPGLPLQQGVPAVIDGAKAVTDAFVILETARVTSTGAEDRRRALAISSLRLHAALVRGWAYADQLSQVLAELYAPLDETLHARFGVRARDLIAWWWAITSMIEDRIAAHRELVREVAEYPLDGDWAGRVREVYPRLPTELTPELIETLHRDPEQRHGFAIIAGDLNLYRVFGFTLDELVKRYPDRAVDPPRLKAVLLGWSLEFGDTSDTPVQHLLLENPVASRPIVRLTEELYLWVGSSAFTHSAFQLLERVFDSDQDLWDAYMDRRGSYLEAKVARSLASRFPNAKVIQNASWTNPADGKRYETDVLVLVDSTVLVAECKGGRLSAQSRRGKGRPLRRDIDELLVEPARQARRLARLLEGSTGDVTLDTTDEGEITIDASKVHKVVTLAAALEPLAGVLPRLREVAEAGLTNEELDGLSYNLSLSDLLVVLDILDHPSEVLHYLARRDELDKGEFLTGEETDLLGFYLRTGFNLGEAEFEREHFMTTFGLSDPIDTYFYGLQAGIDAEKPQPRRTDWWEQLLSTVEQRALPRWTEIGISLCNVAYEEQVDFERSLNVLRDDVKTGQRRPDDFVLFINGPERRRDYFIGLITADGSEPRRQQMEGAAKQVMAEEPEISRVLVIGWCLEPKDAPYETLGLFER